MKKRIAIIAAILSALTILSACAGAPAMTTAAAAATTAAGESSTQKAEYIKITPADAKALMDSETVIVLDVRTQSEYDSGHIKNAVLLDSIDVSAKAASVLPDKKAAILVYCRSGNRSAASSKLLIEMGYTKVMDFGGIIDWPYDIVK